MSDMVMTSGVPEVAIGTGAQPQAATKASVSLDWGDMAKDMAAIASEVGQPTQPAEGQPPAVATEPAKEQAAPTPQAQAAPQPPQPEVEVPEKFRGPDGKLDQGKLLKSYFEAEKTLKRAQNAQAPVAPQVQAQPQAPQNQAPVTPGNLTPFEAQVAQDLINEAAALGYAMPPAQAVAQARVQIRLMDAKHKADTAATIGEVQQFRETLAEQRSQAELENLAKNNAWVLTPQGQAELVKIREEKPWINQSPTPWADAVEILLGRKNQVTQGTPGQVQMPTPKGVQQTAPPLPVTPVPVAQAPIQLNTPEQVEAYVKTLTPAQEAEFWKKSGLKWDSPKHFNGVF